MYSAFLIRCGVHCTPHLFKKANPAKSFVIFINTFNPINHGNGRIYPCFLQRPVAGKGLKWKNLNILLFHQKGLVNRFLFNHVSPKIAIVCLILASIQGYRPSPEKSWAKTYPTESERHKEEAFLSFRTDDHGLTEHNANNDLSICGRIRPQMSSFSVVATRAYNRERHAPSEGRE